MSELYLFVCILMIIFILVAIKNPVYLGGSQNKENFQLYHNKFMKCLEKNCYNTPLTGAQCQMTKNCPCPRLNGSYMQCTDNFKHKVNIANCRERSYYYSPHSERLSEKCVYKNVFPFMLKKEKYNPYTPSVFPRINVWRNDSLDNNFFVKV